MSAFTFLHAADLHLDSPLKGLDLDAPVDRIRRATRDALVNLVDFACERRVAFVLLAGDLYDGDWKDWRTGQFLVQQLGRLARDGIEVVAISGNHDAESVLTLKLPVPGLLPADKPATRLLPHVPVAVHGQGFAVPAVTSNIALGYPAPVDGRFNIGLLHTACGSSAHANYAPCSLDDLLRHGYDYWALGHVHTRSELCRDPPVVFPGNLQGRHINEEGSRGATLVTVEGGRVASVVHHALDVLRWRRLPVAVPDTASRAEILPLAKAALDQAYGEADGRLLVVRVVLHGECAAHAELVASPGETLNQVRGEAAAIAAPDHLWVESVVVDTSPALDVAALRAQSGPIGALVEALERTPVVGTGLLEFVNGQVRRAKDALPPTHPAAQISSGQVPERLIERARAMVLAELARR